MNLFKSGSGVVTSENFSNYLLKLDLRGKNVLVYSRLLSLGRFYGKDSVLEFLQIIKNQIGEDGTLVIASYTLNSYKEPRLFDFDESKIMSGILGELAAKLPEFRRTVHPLYSHCIWGKHTDELFKQNITTCFGENSFFDIFSKLDNAYILMIGLNLNGPSLTHYYEQKYSARGRFLKYFDIQIKFGQQSFMSRFDSFVKDYDFYKNKTHCLARFDALSEVFGIVKHYALGDGYMHMISESNFQMFYKAAIHVDQEYFLVGSEEEWNEYYWRNKFDMYYNEICPERIKKVSIETGFQYKTEV